MPESPLDPHAASPRELQARIAAERRGECFLLYRDGEQAQVIVDLAEAPDRLSVGRRAANDLALGWDPEVSRVHATLERAGRDWLIADDNVSRNGTWVNGARLTGRHTLHDGDLIRIGGTTIAFCAPGPQETSSQPTVTAREAQGIPGLTAAQRRVLVALCRPYRDSVYAAPASNQAIAEELVVSIDAVKGTLGALFSAFGIEDLPQNAKRAALVSAALRSGVVARRDL